MEIAAETLRNLSGALRNLPEIIRTIRTNVDPLPVAFWNY